MTDSAKFRKLSLLLINVLGLLNVFSFLSNSETVYVNSVLTQPVPSQSTENGMTTYKEYYVVEHNSGNPELYELTFTIPSNESVVLYFRSKTVVHFNTTYSQRFNGQVYKYDVITGSLIASYSVGSGASYLLNGYNQAITFVNGNFPNTSAGLKRSYPIIDTNKVWYNNTTFDLVDVDPFVIWSSHAPDPVHYRSYMSEPVADEYNEYLVIGNGEDAYLIWISIEQIEYQSTGASTNNHNHYEGQLWSNTIILQNNSATFNLVYQVPNALDDLSYIAYAVMVSQFDLETGQYISSSLYANQAVSQTISIDISDFVFEIDEISDVCAYGCNLIINDLIINRIAIEWSVSPSWETWKNNVVSYLEEIYSVLSQTGEEVTIEQDTSGMDEARSAVDDLKVTDQNGNEVNAAAQASEAFSQADAGIQDMAEPVSWINGQITDNVFFLPKLLIPVVVALSLGLLITILGKNKSDD